MTTRVHKQEVCWANSISALLFACAGCAGYSHTVAGLPMTDARTAFIRSGVTTRAEVVETLGPPLYDYLPESTIAYAWETEGGNWCSLIFHSWHVDENHGRWLYCVHFADSNRVDRHGKARQLKTESSTDTILRWMDRKAE